MVQDRSILVAANPSLALAQSPTNSLTARSGGALTVLPEDGRTLYFQAIDAANNEIRIEICVLEDPQILQHLQAALSRGVRVRGIVDRGKYSALASEQENLAQYLTSAGGKLHLSNPAFPGSFPKIILIDSRRWSTGRPVSMKRLLFSTGTSRPLTPSLRLLVSSKLFSRTIGGTRPLSGRSRLRSIQPLLSPEAISSSRPLTVPPDWYDSISRRSERSMSTPSCSEI